MASAIDNILIAIKYQVDTDDIKRMKAELNQTRNQLNAAARDLTKNSAAWKQLKTEVRDINTVLKLTDQQFAQGIAGMRSQRLEAEKLANANATLNQRFKTVTTTGRDYKKSLDLGARGLSTIVHGVITLNPLLKDQQGALGDVSKAIDEYGVSILAGSSLLRDFGSIIKSFNVGFLATAGLLTTATAGFSAVAAEIYLMGKNLKYAIDLWNANGSFWDFMTSGVFNPSDKLDKQYPGSYELNADYLSDSEKAAIERNKKKARDAGFIYDDPAGPGNLDGRNAFNQRSSDNSRGRGNTKETREETLTYLAQLKKELGEIQTLIGRQTAAENEAGGFLIKERDLTNLIYYVENLKELQKITSGIGGVNSEGRTPIAPIPEDPLLKFRIQIQDQEANKKNDLLSDVDTVYSGISSILNELKIGADTFVGRLISGFNSVLVIMEAIKAVNTVLSIIPGFASGGVAPAGMPYMAGERGTELIFPQTNHRILNHSDTMRYLNNSSGNSPVNIYLSSNIDQRYLTAGIEKYNSAKSYMKVSKR